MPLIPIPLTPESPARQRFVDEHPHGHRGVHDQLCKRAGSDTPDALGLAAVVAEGELVEIGLQVFVAHGAAMRAEHPALEQRDRPVAALQGIGRAPLGLGLHFAVVGPLAQALLVVAGEPVGDDLRIGGDLAGSRPKSGGNLRKA